MFLPLPFFWALFDMQGSRWTISATQMNGWQGGDAFKMRPDQIQILNPIMILLFLPLFSKVKNKPLRSDSHHCPLTIEIWKLFLGRLSTH